mmetsp:Transcript_6743/g.9796  ORF Transcript_6743/g.9796 Transcript_6743/m.9796 type:complete len:92 (-) Transcript_6743:557-832(-)
MDLGVKRPLTRICLMFAYKPEATTTKRIRRVLVKYGRTPAKMKANPNIISDVISSPNHIITNNVELKRFPEFSRECTGAATKLSTKREAAL